MSAPKGGDVLRSDEDRAPRRQTESPKKSSTCSPGHKARQPEVQGVNTIRVRPDGDQSRPITNAGHAKASIKAIRRMIEAEHGECGCRGPEQRDYFVAIAWLEETAAAADPTYDRSLPTMVLRYFPKLSPADQAEAMDEVRATPYQITHRALGELMCLTFEKRERFGFRYAEPIGMTMADVKREKDRLSKEERRRAKGIPKRGEQFAQAKLLDPDAPRSTTYDRIQHNRKARGRPKIGVAELDATSGLGGYLHP